MKINKKKVASIGTLGIKSIYKKIPMNNTTLDPVTLSLSLKKLKKQKINDVILEASSHGLDQNRLTLLLAILHKHSGIATFDQDVFINVVGGIKVSETASDLVVMLAIVSSLRDKVIPSNWIAFGEVGLTGEVRPVYNAQERLSEAQKQGFEVAIIPKANLPKKNIKGMKIISVRYLFEAIKYLLENSEQFQFSLNHQLEGQYYFLNFLFQKEFEILSIYSNQKLFEAHQIEKCLN